jgi:hypothetical protein
MSFYLRTLTSVVCINHLITNFKPMTQLKPFLAVVFFVFCLNFNGYSSAGIGYEISYQEVDSLKYDVDFIVYRYCGGVKLNTNFTTPYVVCQTSGSKRSLNWKIVSIQEIKTECDSIGARCNPPNTSFTGAGYERIVLRATVDFKLGAFDSFYNAGCTSIRFEMDDCCRNSSISVGLANAKMYTFAELNLDFDEGNSSPTFTSRPLITACCNQPVYYNIGALDTDNDSLSYAFAQPLSAYGSGLSYSGNYKYNQPIDCYFPGSLKPPYNNPNANPPIGMYLDPEIGEMIFTPVHCSEFTAFVIEVTEWRKDSKGNMVVAGKTRRDIELRQKQCPGNNPPIILSDAFQSRACEGQELCFTIESKDYIKTPPPPNPKPDQDSVFLSWNRGIPSATFKITQDTFESAKFCWTPDTGSARSVPYTFIVYADDDQCGDVLKTQRTFKIYVNPSSPSYTLAIDSTSCGKFTLDNSLSAAVYSKLRFSLSIQPIPGTTSNVYFSSTGLNTSRHPEDVINISRNGTYELTYSLECGETVIDTLVINSFPEMKMPNDMEVCYDAGNIDLTQFDTLGKRGIWTCPANSSLVDTTGTFLTNKVNVSSLSSRYVIYYTIGSGNCGYQDSFKIKVNPLPRVEVRDASFCQTNYAIDVRQDKIVVLPGGGSLSLGRQKWSCVDCGGYIESDVIKDHGSAVPGAPQQYKIHIDPSAVNLAGLSSDSLFIEFEFRNVFGCFNRDTTKIIVHAAPKPTTARLLEWCWSQEVVNLNTDVFHTRVTGDWESYNTFGYTNAHTLNTAIKDSLFHINQTGRPSVNGDSVYRVRFNGSTDYCTFKMDTTVRILGVPNTKIDHRPISDVHWSIEPYSLCELDDNILMKASPAGGYWTAVENLFVQETFLPSWVTNFNTPFYLTYNNRNTNGCIGKDSVQVVVHKLGTLNISNDTAITWYADNMSLDVKATYDSSTGVVWIPLGGTTVDDATADKTTWRFSGGKDTVQRHLLYAKTLENTNNVCPFTDRTMVATIHPTPCMDITMDYTVSTKKLQLSPSNENMRSYRWIVDGKTYTTKNPLIDLSKASDSIILVKLVATNRIGDTCVSYNKINVNNGSVRDINQLISLYPNPVKTGFTIDSKTDLTGSVVQIFNGNGKLVQSKVLSDNYVDCENLSAGLYTIRVQTYEAQFIGRFVKE